MQFGKSCITTPHNRDESNHLAAGTTHLSSTLQCQCHIMLTRSKIAVMHDFFVKSLLHFSKFLVNANFNLITNYILRETNKQHF